jgi:hypothetical protein
VKNEMSLRSKTPGWAIQSHSQASESGVWQRPTLALYTHSPSEVNLAGDRVMVAATPMALLAVVCGLVLFGLTLRATA